MKNRDFTKHNVKFHLNDNPFHNEYEGKYKLLWWNDNYKTGPFWSEVCTVNTKKEALQYIEEFYNNKTKMFSTWYA